MSKETVQAVILAGGFGRRMGIITENTQKCLLPIDGKPILGHIFDSLLEAFGSVNVLMCVSFKADDVKEFVDKNKPNKMFVSYIWDSGYSRTADLYRGIEDHISGPFIGISGDMIVLSDAYKSGFEKFETERMFASVTLSPKLNEANSHAVGKIKNNQLISLILPAPEKLDSDHLRDMTVWCLDDRYYIFARKYPEIGAMPKLLQKAIEEGKYIVGNVYNGKWIHIGYPNDLSKIMRG
jgi:NDP-sugar pyrophosphorylase family protein